MYEVGIIPRASLRAEVGTAKLLIAPGDDAFGEFRRQGELCSQPGQGNRPPPDAFGLRVVDPPMAPDVFLDALAFHLGHFDVAPEVRTSLATSLGHGFEERLSLLIRNVGEVLSAVLKHDDVRSVKEECLDHLILSSGNQFRYVLSEYLQYYHHERIHQGINKIIEPQHEGDQGGIICIERLGGPLKSYHRKAARHPGGIVHVWR